MRIINLSTVNLSTFAKKNGIDLYDFVLRKDFDSLSRNVFVVTKTSERFQPKKVAVFFVRNSDAFLATFDLTNMKRELLETTHVKNGVDLEGVLVPFKNIKQHCMDLCQLSHGVIFEHI